MRVIVIGIIGLSVALGSAVWCVREALIYRILLMARRQFPDRTVRYEGVVRYVQGPFAELAGDTGVYLSIVDGAVCLASRDRYFQVIDAATITAAAAVEQGEECLMQLRFTNDTGSHVLTLGAKGARARQIVRSLPVKERQGA